MTPHEKVHVVPWANPEQFYKVYSSLYSPDITSKRWAVEQISVWETRCPRSLPTAVEATTVIVRAIIQDILFENNASFCQERDIRLFYAMAVVRFVNLTVELDQNAPNKISMSIIANKRDIPSWIVELRHQATHGILPSLSMFRMGVEFALQYLDRTFWKIEACNLQKWVRTLEDNEPQIALVISKYQLLQFDLLQNFKVKEPEDLEDAWNDIRACIKKYRRKFIEVFVQNGLFISSKHQLEEMLRSTACLEWINKQPAKQDDFEYIENEELYFLPDIVQWFWKPVICSLHKNDLLSDFLEILLLTQNDRDPLGQKLAISWVLKLLQTTLFSIPEESELTKEFQKHGTLFDWRRLLYACLKYPVRWSKHIMPLIFTQAGLSKIWTMKFMHLSTIFQGCVLSEKDLEGKKFYVFTLEDLKKRMELEAREKRKMEALTEEENIWSYAPGNIEFHNLPFGSVINGKEVDFSDDDDDNMKMLDDEGSDDKSDEEQYIFVNDNEEIEKILITNDSATFKEDQRTASPATDMVYKREEL